MIDNFRKSVLTPLINSNFNITSNEDDNTFLGKLVEIENSGCNGDQWEAFTAVFSIPKEKGITLAEKEYTIKHDEIGDVTLFGSPNSENELEFCCSFRIED